MKKIWVLCAMLAAVVVPQVQGNSFSNSATGLVSPQFTVTFSEHSFANATLITNQFADVGVSFSPNLYYNANGSGIYNGSGASGDYLANFGTSGNPCCTAPFEIDFASQVTDAAFQMITNRGTSTISAFLGNTLVDSMTVGTSYPNNSDFYGFTGEAFDSIHVSPGGSGSQMVMDNVEFNSNAVPEPGSLMLLGTGLLGVGRLVRRKIAR